MSGQRLALSGRRGGAAYEDVAEWLRQRAATPRIPVQFRTSSLHACMASGYEPVESLMDTCRFDSCHAYHGGVAKPVQPWSHKPEIVGSSPTPATGDNLVRTRGDENARSQLGLLRGHLDVTLNGFVAQWIRAAPFYGVGCAFESRRGLGSLRFG